MVTIRRATEDDAKAVAELWADLGRHLPPAGKRWALVPDAAARWRAHLVRHFVGGETGLALVAEEGGEVVGYVTATLREKPPLYANPRVLQIDTVAVAPRRQHRGVGRALLDGALAWGREQGAQSAEITTSFYNVPARATWRKFGFDEALITMSRDL